MVAYPIRVPRKQYLGAKPSLRRKTAEHNELAKILEKHINDCVAERDDEIQVYIYGFIAADLGLRVDDVRAVLYGVDAGHNGLTIVKRPMTEF